MEKTENRKLLIVFGIIVTALLVILASILGLHIPAVPVCVIVLLEAGMAVCLHDVQIWLHGLVIAAQVIAGVVTGNVVFMLLCCVIYLVGIFALKYLRD